MAAQRAFRVTSRPDLPLLLLTRPRPQSERFALEARAACPPHRLLIAPLSEIVALPVAPGALEGATLVFTSANGVAAVAGLRRVAGQVAWCVGPATAEAARATGFAVRESGGDAARLLADLRAARPAGRLLHLRGRDVACDLARALAEEGLEAEALVAYEAREVAWNATARRAFTSADGREAAGGRVVAPIFSPRAATAFSARLAEIGAEGARDLRIAAISPTCAARLSPGLRARAVVAERPDGAAMLRAVASLLAPEGDAPGRAFGSEP